MCTNFHLPFLTTGIIAEFGLKGSNEPLLLVQSLRGICDVMMIEYMLIVIAY